MLAFASQLPVLRSSRLRRVFDHLRSDRYLMSRREPLSWVLKRRALLTAVCSEKMHPRLAKYLNMIESLMLAPMIVTLANDSKIEGASKPCTSRECTSPA